MSLSGQRASSNVTRVKSEKMCVRVSAFMITWLTWEDCTFRSHYRQLAEILLVILSLQWELCCSFCRV